MRAAHVLALVFLAGVLTGCARLHARAEPITPALEIPPPPPRVITATLPATATAPATAEALPADAPTPAFQPPEDVASRRPQRGTPTAPAARQEKPEPVPLAPARPATPTGPASPTLQTTTKVEEVEQKVRATIAQATRDLTRIDARALNAEARAQLDIAKRFVQQAGDALTAKNFVFAGQLADKAAALATLLLSQ